MTGRFRNSIAQALFSSYFLMIVVTIAVMFVLSYLFFYNTLEKKSLQYNELMMMSVHDRMESQLSEVVQATFQIYHPEVHALVNHLHRLGYRPDSWEYQNYRSKALVPLRILEKTEVFSSGANGIYFLDRQGEPYVQSGMTITRTGESFVKSSEYERIVGNLGGPVIHVVATEEWFAGSGASRPKPEDKTVLIGRRIVNTIQSRDLGLLLIAVDFNWLVQSIAHRLPDSQRYFVLLDAAGEVLFSSGPGSEEERRELVENLRGSDSRNAVFRFGQEQYLISYQQSQTSGWTYLNLTPYAEIRKEVTFLSQIVLACTLAALIASLVIAVYFSRRLIRPIKKMENFAHDIEQGRLESRLQMRSYREFNQLAKVFNQMINQQQTMIENNYLLNLRKQEAEMKALQAQINPHFLYNALNSIHAYAHLSDNTEIVDMTYALSDMLRYSLRHADSLVLIADELLHCKHYMLIQNIRYGNEIAYEQQVEPGLDRCQTLPFVLQPLIENALIHGLSERETDKRVELSITRQGERLMLQVADNGKGMDEQQRTSLLAWIYAKEQQTAQGRERGMKIGLRNVHQRVQMVFGPQYGIEIRSVPGVGTQVQVWLPGKLLDTGQIATGDEATENRPVFS